MSAPLCTVIEAAEMAAFGTALAHLWIITFVGVALLRVDSFDWEWRFRKHFRRRRMQRIRAARLVEQGA